MNKVQLSDIVLATRRQLEEYQSLIEHQNEYGDSEFIKVVDGAVTPRQATILIVAVFLNIKYVYAKRFYYRHKRFMEWQPGTKKKQKIGTRKTKNISN